MLRPDSWSWPPLTGLRNHTHWTHHTRWDSSGRALGPKQRPLPDNTQHSQQTNIHATGRIRTRNPSKRAATDPCLVPRDHWDQLNKFFIFANFRLNDNSIITELRSARPFIFDFQKRRNYVIFSETSRPSLLPTQPPAPGTPGAPFLKV